jgi:hypothetical protein
LTGIPNFKKMGVCAELAYDCPNGADMTQSTSTGGRENQEEVEYTRSVTRHVPVFRAIEKIVKDARDS